MAADRTLNEAMGLDPAELAELRARVLRLWRRKG